MMAFSGYGVKPRSGCESCEFFSYDEERATECCSLSLDEDEMADFLNRNTARCPYYRFYDEYKSVNKQI